MKFKPRYPTPCHSHVNVHLATMSASTCNFSINVLTLDVLPLGVFLGTNNSPNSHTGANKLCSVLKRLFVQRYHPVIWLAFHWKVHHDLCATGNPSVVGAVARVYSQKDYGLAPWSSMSQRQRVLGPWRGRVCQEVMKSLGTTLSTEIKCFPLASWKGVPEKIVSYKVRSPVLSPFCLQPGFFLFLFFAV